MTGASQPGAHDERRATPREIASLRQRIDELERERADALDRNRLVLAVQDATNRIVAAKSSDAALRDLLRAMRDPLGFSRAIYCTVDRTSSGRGPSTVAVSRMRVDGSNVIEASDDRLDVAEGSHALAVLRGEPERTGRGDDLCAPLVDVRGWYVLCRVGSAGLLYVDGHACSDTLAWEAGQVDNMASIAAIVMERGALLARTIELAERDSLTGLFNRRSLSERLAAAMTPPDGSRASFAYVAIDVDDFKAVNDRLGHAGGDEVLRNVASALLENSRPQDVVSRTGGDEFAMLIANVDADLARSLVARLSDDLRARRLRCSIGAALFPSDASTGHDVTIAADRALYDAKAAGKDGFAFFTARRQAAGAPGCDESTAIFHVPPTSRQITR